MAWNSKDYKKGTCCFRHLEINQNKTQVVGDQVQGNISKIKF